MDLVRTNLEGLSEDDKVFYKKGQDDKYHLNHKFAEKSQIIEKSTQSISEKNRQLYERDEQLKKQQQEIDALKLAQEKTAKSDTPKDDKVSQRTIELEEQVKVLKENDEKNRETIKANKLTTLLAEACEKTGANVHFMGKLINTDYTTDGIPCVKDEAGKVMLSETGTPLTIEAHLKQLSEDDAHKALFSKNVPSGANFKGGFSGGQTGGEDFSKFDKMNLYNTNRSEFIKNAVLAGQARAKNTK